MVTQRKARLLGKRADSSKDETPKTGAPRVNLKICLDLKTQPDGCILHEPFNDGVAINQSLFAVPIVISFSGNRIEIARRRIKIARIR
ncbi:MAG: hypothetical protein J0H75_03990 [Rhizobiales bacterium]|nr:hypothetical protein [Hyphomicrobiales bacterium]